MTPGSLELESQVVDQMLPALTAFELTIKLLIAIEAKKIVDAYTGKHAPRYYKKPGSPTTTPEFRMGVTYHLAVVFPTRVATVPGQWTAVEQSTTSPPEHAAATPVAGRLVLPAQLQQPSPSVTRAVSTPKQAILTRPARAYIYWQERGYPVSTLRPPQG